MQNRNVGRSAPHVFDNLVPSSAALQRAQCGHPTLPLGRRAIAAPHGDSRGACGANAGGAL